ncbi:MAG: hypothetical protein ACI9MR_003356, partial [Myxococcota bacterium]
MNRVKLSMLAVAGAGLLIGGCSDASTGSDDGGGKVSVSVAPLSLTGVTGAEYTIKVTNAPYPGGQTVWEETVNTNQFGDGSGSLSYVGTCDASVSPVQNSVTLTLLDLYEDQAGSDVIIPRDTYRNPSPIYLDIECKENADVPVVFNLVVLRDAEQGFFDIAVNFDDVFCSAKLDCEQAPGQPLELLHNPSTGLREQTVVMGFACTGSAGASDTTVQYANAIVVSCDAGANATAIVASAGPGNVDLTDPSQATLTGTSPLFGAAVYRGVEQLGFDKQFWNVALGLNGGANCTISALGTASDGPFNDLTTPAATAWPVIRWNVSLTDANGVVVCSQHPLNDDTCPASGVCTEYTEIDEPQVFADCFDGVGTCVPTLGTFPDPAASCLALKEALPDAESGAYYLDPDGDDLNLLLVYCDMDFEYGGDTGGWTLVVKHTMEGTPTTASVQEVAEMATLENPTNTNAKLADADINTLQWTEWRLEAADDFDVRDPQRHMVSQSGLQFNVNWPARYLDFASGSPDNGRNQQWCYVETPSFGDLCMAVGNTNTYSVAPHE